MVTIKQLQKALPALQLKFVTESSKIDYQRLRRKIQSGKQLDLDESKQLYEALQGFGITLNPDEKTD